MNYRNLFGRGEQCWSMGRSWRQGAATQLLDWPSWSSQFKISRTPQTFEYQGQAKSLFTKNTLDSIISVPLTSRGLQANPGSIQPLYFLSLLILPSTQGPRFKWDLTVYILSTFQKPDHCALGMKCPSKAYMLKAWSLRQCSEAGF